MRLLSSTKLLRREGFDPNERIGELHMIANDRYIAQSLSDRTVHILSSSTGVLQRSLVHPVGRPFSLAFDNDSIMLACGTDDKLLVYDILSGDLLHTLVCSNRQNIYRIDSTQEGNTCVVVAYHFDGSASVWDVRAGTQLHTLQLHDGEPAFKTQLVDDQVITSSSCNGTVAVWNWKNGLLVWNQSPGEPDPTTSSYAKGGNGVFALKVSNRKVTAGTKDGRVCAWDLDSGVELATWQASKSMVKNLVYYDKWLLQSSAGEVQIWSTDTYQRVHSVRLFDRSCDTLGVLDGVLISCGRDASTAVENDVCGLDEGVKGWRLAWGDEIQDQEYPLDKKNNPESTEGYVKETQDFNQKVFHIGAPARQARGLAVLTDRVVVSVMRGGTWVIEIWAKD